MFVRASIRQLQLSDLAAQHRNSLLLAPVRQDLRCKLLAHSQFAVQTISLWLITNVVVPQIVTLSINLLQLIAIPIIMALIVS